MKQVAWFLIFFLPVLALGAEYPISWKKNPFNGSTYIVPTTSVKSTSVIMLHGSEGGSTAFIDSEAYLLAAQGYSVLLYCYFDCNRDLVGPRETLKDVEATKLLDAVAWLQEQPTSNGKVVVYGFSRGAELTMIVGSLSTTPKNKPDGLVAHAPSDVFNPAFNWSWRDPVCWLCVLSDGSCSEQSPPTVYRWNMSCGPDDPTKFDFSVSAWKVSGNVVVANQRIKIEKFRGPILLTVGEADEVWPADQTRRIEATLKAKGQPVEAHYFAGEGHNFRGQNEVARRKLVLDFLSRFSD